MDQKLNAVYAIEKSYLYGITKKVHADQLTYVLNANQSCLIDHLVQEMPWILLIPAALLKEIRDVIEFDSE